MSDEYERQKRLEAALARAEREQVLAARVRGDWFRTAEFILQPQDTGAGNLLTLRHTDHSAECVRNYPRLGKCSGACKFGRILEGYAKMKEAIDKSRMVVVRAASKLGKSTLITYADSLIRIGEDSANARIFIGAALKGNAVKHSLYIRDQIDNNPRFKLVYPNVEKGDKWTEDLWQVKGSTQAQPTMQAVGDLAQVQGFRYSVHIFDDMMDSSNSLSKDYCEKQARWVMAIHDRVDPGTGLRRYILNPQSIWDTGHILVDKYEWDEYIMPAIDEAGKTLYPRIWPQHVCDAWPKSRVNPDLRAQDNAEGTRVFLDEYIDLSYRLGDGLTLEPLVHQSTLPDGVFIVHGLDPAGVKKEETARGDQWALATGLVGPPEYFLASNKLSVEADEEVLLRLVRHNQGARDTDKISAIQLLDIDAGKWGVVDGQQHVVDRWNRYGGAVIVESNAVQEWLVELLGRSHSEIQVHAQHTGANKSHAEYGVSAMARFMANGCFLFPSRLGPDGKRIVHPRVSDLTKALSGYTPTAHMPDRVSALWLVRCGALIFKPRFHAVSTIDIVPQPVHDTSRPLDHIWSELELRAEKAGTTLRPPSRDEANKAESDHQALRERIRRSRFG